MDEQLVEDMVKAYCRCEDARERVNWYARARPYFKVVHDGQKAVMNDAELEFELALNAVVEDVYPGFILKEEQDDVTEV